jgi:hypothetical protein
MILPMHGCRFQRSALPDEGMTMPALGGWHPIGWFRSDVSTKTEKVDDFVFRIYSRHFPDLLASAEPTVRLDAAKLLFDARSHQCFAQP